MMIKKILSSRCPECRLSSTGRAAPATLALLLSLVSAPVFSARDGSGYIGLEFLGSTQLSRLEIEKILALKPGATLESARKALERLKAKLELKHIKTNIDLVPGDRNNFFIAIDVVESGLSNKLPTRALQNPHHVFLNNEKPFTLLEQLRVRQDKLIETGRPTDESYREGMKTFSDEPSQRIAEQEVKELEGQQRSLLTIVSTDPNPNRRVSAIELLNFVPDWLSSCVALIPAIDDSDAGVRAAATKFIWARLPNMPDDFPFQDLMEGLSRQLMRPSHGDRTRSLACLISLCKRDSDAISAVKEFDSERLKQITDSSILPEVQAMAGQLMKVASNPPPVKRKPGQPSDLGSGF
ncbi:MAG: hypothetical protein K2W95_19520 [Candidatus Obscuribacterales bacterium]|nr:hypothetical protein [Candidatus Obscuribacterales bacterium]